MPRCLVHGAEAPPFERRRLLAANAGGRDGGNAGKPAHDHGDVFTRRDGLEKDRDADAGIAAGGRRGKQAVPHAPACRRQRTGVAACTRVPVGEEGVVLYIEAAPHRAPENIRLAAGRQAQFADRNVYG